MPSQRVGTSIFLRTTYTYEVRSRVGASAYLDIFHPTLLRTGLPALLADIQGIIRDGLHQLAHDRKEFFSPLKKNTIPKYTDTMY
jgi:hypothetical protein